MSLKVIQTNTIRKFDNGANRANRLHDFYEILSIYAHLYIMPYVVNLVW